jgi:hypothetical protein
MNSKRKKQLRERERIEMKERRKAGLVTMNDVKTKQDIEMKKNRKNRFNARIIRG